ncbi:hypothetical protein T8J41_19130 [Nitratireductor rhodophyticola]|uniref:hypothetical protein n=1 Tax=Nitratireductor rhodophyticola TaxID=2854036 RepID=UPI0008141588|nr:hypothetical protein [Nitratireductor rhodophyticola]MEC9247131.1 hypothetical protein [Pseudomonadota bacterium]WPZ14213.1 hypothetical protein T8J41_19130 [Nitratireductor rhodophyticola]
MQTVLPEHHETASSSLELVELELALKHQDFVELGFEGAVRQALDQINGRLLFHMRLDGMNDCDWVAAVVLEEHDEHAYALVVQRTGSGSLEVEDINTSELPVARIVNAYAGLMTSLDRVQ